MSQLDLELLLWLNQFFASDSFYFNTALVQTNDIPWLITTVLIVFYWFSKNDSCGFIYRKDIVFLVFCSISAFILAKPLAHYIGHVRPLLELDLMHTLDDYHWKKLISGFKNSSSTPNDLASFLWAFTVAMFFVEKRIAVLMGLYSVTVCTMAVAVGYLYPSDIVYSLLFGGLLTMVVFLSRQWLEVFCDWVLSCFEYFPAIAYPAAFMLMYDMNHYMAFFQYLLNLTFGIRIAQ